MYSVPQSPSIVNSKGRKIVPHVTAMNAGTQQGDGGEVTVQFLMIINDYESINDDGGIVWH